MKAFKRELPPYDIIANKKRRLSHNPAGAGGSNHIRFTGFAFHARDN